MVTRYRFSGQLRALNQDRLSIAPTPSGPPVPGYVGWWDASRLTGLADGASLATWPDLSGNGNDLVQADTALQAAYFKTTSDKLVNGLPAVWFNDPRTVNGDSYAVTLAETISGDPGGTLFFLAGVAGDFRTPFLCDGIDGGHRWAIGSTQASPDILWGFYNGFLVNTQPITTPTGPTVWTGVFAAGLQQVWQNDSVLADGADASNDDLTGMTLGSDVSLSDFLESMVCEAILFDFVLTSDQITAMQAYLHDKWIG